MTIRRGMTITKNRSKNGSRERSHKNALKFRNLNPAGLPYCAAVDYPLEQTRYVFWNQQMRDSRSYQGFTGLLPAFVVRGERRSRIPEDVSIGFGDPMGLRTKVLSAAY
jgi:hypothetical protein